MYLFYVSIEQEAGAYFFKAIHIHTLFKNKHIYESVI